MELKDIESCYHCGVIYDKSIVQAEHETVCVDACKEYYITYDRMRCPSCDYPIVDKRLYNGKEPANDTDQKG